MQDSYWSRFTDSRMSRRRALTLTGGTALGAAFLAACGGSEEQQQRQRRQQRPEGQLRPTDAA